jgi:TrmH family RNA methyltransferase
MADEKYDNVKIYTLSSGCFEKISTEKSPQGIIVIIKYLDFFKSCNKIIEENFSSDDGKSSIILSSMRDPGNVGAVIRSALAFGAQRIIMSSDCADIYNPKTIRASMGCIFKLEILISDDLCRTVKALRHAGRRVFAAELRENAISLDESGIGKSDIVIIGNEGHGLDEALSRECDGSIFIPISSGAESLNAAVAAAIFMREQNK